ncbi:hypothetical protein KFL_000200350 [Klebsormidium nitens]|uniref:GDSL esterase/lipase n=1 Tax=Klebsormidium nitens TaxID=105231 RepID=A0A1Y1HLM2_KLENI|nr:hypothetical protein KFL_000200350 [Klebsormidium nitens]|eukprot:GAQ78883.1 hypothetical protein KFL_000200350 [Klebsormidium nitens]
MGAPRIHFFAVLIVFSCALPAFSLNFYQRSATPGEAVETSSGIGRRLLQSAANTSQSPGPAVALNATANGFVYKASLVYPVFPALFVFGDSLVDTGNIVILDPESSAKGYPNGVTPGGRLNVTGRPCNGPNTVDYLAEFLGLPFGDPILLPGGNFFYGANFASAGSGALNSTGNPKTAMPLFNQTQLFAKFVQDSATYWRTSAAAADVTPRFPHPDAFGSALYVFATGGNDLRNFVQVLTNPAGLAQAVLASIRSAVTDTYALGARNILIANVPPAHCAPALRNLSPTGTCFASIAPVVQTLSAGFDPLVQQLGAALPNATVLLGDLYNFTSDAIAYPAAFGLTVADRACCGAGGPANVATPCSAPGFSVCDDPDRSLFWDGLHGTTAFYRLVAREILAGSTYVRPNNLLDEFVKTKLLKV